MAGTIFLEDGRDWNARSSTFILVVEWAAEGAVDPRLKARLNEIAEVNLGSFSMTDFPVNQREELTGLLRALPARARQALPESPERQAVLERMESLARMV